MRTAIIVSAVVLSSLIGAILGIVLAEGALWAMGYSSLAAFLLRGAA